jgi:N-acetylneuraminate synthase
MHTPINSWLDTPSNCSPCAIIAEVAQSHDGSLGTAHAYIDAAAKAGANAIKFQTHIADEESSSDEPWRTKFSFQDETRLDYWRRMEFTPAQWLGLKQHADDAGIHFLSSPFSLKAVDLLEQIGISAWKVASGEITNTILLDHILDTGKPIILSTGLSNTQEISAAVAHVSKKKNPLALLQCTSEYPCRAEKIGLNVIEEFRSNYNCAVGLSDHSGSIFSGLAAAALNIQILETHITFSREMFGPDVIASITTDELKQLVEGIRYIEKINANPIDKAVIDENAQSLRDIFMKSIFSRSSISAGQQITIDMIVMKKPGTGIAANQLDLVVGKTARKNIPANTLINPNDLE